MWVPGGLTWPSGFEKCTESLSRGGSMWRSTLIPVPIGKSLPRGAFTSPTLPRTTVHLPRRLQQLLTPQEKSQEEPEVRCSQPKVSHNTVPSSSGWNQRRGQEEVRRTKRSLTQCSKATGAEKVRETARPECERYYLHVLLKIPMTARTGEVI